MKVWLKEVGEWSMTFTQKEETEGGTDGQGSGHVTLEAHIRHSGGDTGLAIGLTSLELRGHDDEGMNSGDVVDIRIACPMYLSMITTPIYVPVSIFPTCFGEQLCPCTRSGS